MRGDHVRMVDWMVGQITQVLADLNIDKNTMIIFTSDNGPKPAGVDGKEYGGPDKKFGHKSAGVLRGYKTSLWDGGHRVPFIASWPGKIKPGAQSGTLFCLTDILATLAAITEYTLEKDMGEDSFNFLPALLGEEKAIRESIVHHDYGGNFSIRKGEWKLVHNKLFNIIEDIQESNDLAKDYPEKVEELNALLEKYIIEGRTASYTK